MNFTDKLERAVRERRSLLCVGLDPDPERIPALRAPGADARAILVTWGRAIIEQTAEMACCYKPNSAFFEQFGAEGWLALRELIAALPEGTPALLDIKRGDIGNTARAYARAAFEGLGADAVTLSPYLGRDSVAPFLEHADKGVFLLAHTSNPSAAEVQHHGLEPLYRHVVRRAQRWGDPRRVGFVVGATQPEALAHVRALAPDSWILAPGIGAQGGDLEQALAAGLDAAGSGLLVPVSRAVLYAPDPRAAAEGLRAHIETARRQPQRSPSRSVGLIRALFEAGCVKFGSFTLASGATSPIYLDLRRAVSYPTLLRQMATALADLARDLSYELLAPVPYAALPAATAAALLLDRPLVYPRKEAKGHGTGRSVEGNFTAGQRALVVEDVVTSGRSVLTAIQSLESAGLAVRDVLALVNREQGGGEALAARGYTLHAALTLREILTALKAEELIDATTARTVVAYLNEEIAHG